MSLCSLEARLSADFSLRVVLAKVLQLIKWIRLDGVFARLPVSRAHFTVLFMELERLHKSENLSHASSHRRIVESGVTDNSLGIDQEESTHGETFRWNDDVIGFSHSPSNVSNERDLEVRSQASIS